MLIDGSSSREIRANFFDKDIFFTFWFYLINIYLFRVIIYRNNQGIINKKKAKNIGIGKVTQRKI